MVSSTVAFATLFFSRQSGASPAGVFANIPSCKCLTAPGNGELKTSDCTTDLQNLGNQDFAFDDQDSFLGDADGPICVSAADPHDILPGQRAVFGNCTSEIFASYNSTSSKLVVNLPQISYDIIMGPEDTLIFATPDDYAENHFFEFHCSACFGDEGWTCGGSPAPVPSPDPAPAPAPFGSTTTLEPLPANTTLAPSAAVQIQWNEVDNLCIDLPGGNTSNGALLWMWDCYGGETQQWSFQDGQLVYLSDPSKCVDLLGGDTTNGNMLGIWDCNQGDSQMWGFDPDWGTLYLASSAASDATKCAMFGGEHSGSEALGVPVTIWDCYSITSENQLWQTWIVNAPGTPYPGTSLEVV